MSWVFGAWKKGVGWQMEDKKKKKERKKTKEEDGQEIESYGLDFHVDLLVHLSFAST